MSSLGLSVSKPVPQPVQKASKGEPLNEFEQKFVDEWVKAFVKDVGRIRLSITFLELFTVLIQRGIIHPFTDVAEIPIPSNTSITITTNIPKGEVSVVTQTRFMPSANNVIAFTLQIDNREPLITDPSAVQLQYQYPLNLLEVGALIPAERYVITTLTNLTQTQQTANLMEFGGRTGKPFWDALVKAYFVVIEEETIGPQT